MITIKVVQVFRNTNNRIYGYRVQDSRGITKDMTPEQLKFAMRNNSVKVSNYKLTSDNKLIKSKEEFKPDITDSYMLMNKDKVVAKFDINFGILEIYNKMPYSFTDIREWMDLRARFSCVHDAKKFFKSIGINDTLEVLDMSPIFDNKYSLLPRFIEDYDTFNREDYIAHDNRTFAELYSLVKRYKSFRSELISLKKLRLLKPDNVDISNKRLKFLNNLLQLQVDYLMEN